MSTDEVVVVGAPDAPIARTRSALRVLETASPPTYYIPETDIDWSQLRAIPNHSFCEWKGQASYFALLDDPRDRAVAWLYANPSASFAAIDRHVSFYPARVECWVNGERVRPQAGGFYGGWITDRLVGPFKGEPGTGHW
ncbi:conserved domain protein [gamma proteobacterium NOR5-3]|nr:conserved domain protein [gamma proteobacterium NOR5-3]